MQQTADAADHKALIVEMTVAQLQISLLAVKTECFSDSSEISQL
jgi:hypothetical protein